MIVLDLQDAYFHILHLRRSGILVFPYLDDWLVKADSPQTIITHLPTTANLLNSLGSTINVLKSHMIPLQMLPFIRAILDMIRFRAFTQSRESRTFGL